jgi:uncharacterized membrane protein YbhN (UPF0104 family)
MSNRTRLLLFGCGAALFGYLISRVGLKELIGTAAQTGWMFVVILLVYGLVYACNAWAWLLIMAGEPRRPSFWRVYLVTVSGFALNFVTPMVNVGGEPFKIAAVAPWLTTRRAAGSVIIHNGLRILSFLLAWLTAIALGFVMLPHDWITLTALAVAGVLVAALTALLLAAHRRGALAAVLSALHRVPGLRALARAIEPRRELLVQMDEQIVHVYHAHPGRFVCALGLEYLSRCLYMAEFYLIAVSIGLPMSYAQAFLVGGLTTLAQNLMFVIPYEVGAKEAAFYLMFQMIGFPPKLGVYTALVSRVRDLIWIGLGLALVWSAGRGRPAEAVS